jgi:hypothetical protein
MSFKAFYFTLAVVNYFLGCYSLFTNLWFALAAFLAAVLCVKWGMEA